VQDHIYSIENQITDRNIKEIKLKIKDSFKLNLTDRSNEIYEE